jgi:hypothetical protein
MGQEIIAHKEAEKDKIVNNPFQIVSECDSGPHELQMQVLPD